MKRIILKLPKIGTLYLSRFSADYDNGLYAKRPWHVVTFGRSFATVAECLDFLADIVANWDDAEDEDGSFAGDCHGEMTHSFLSTEASLDSCPW